MQKQYDFIAKTPLKTLILEAQIPGLDKLLSTQILIDQALRLLLGAAADRGRDREKQPQEHQADVRQDGGVPDVDVILIEKEMEIEIEMEMVVNFFRNGTDNSTTPTRTRPS